MSISAYGYTYNCIRMRIPFEAAIRSMLEIVDEVVVCDGESNDGTYDVLRGIEGVDVFQMPYDLSEPRIDTIMKMNARHRCKTNLLWPLDMDEIIHEKDIAEWRELLTGFKEDEDLMVLPMVDFWGRSRFQLRYKIQGVYWNASGMIQGIIKEDRWINPRTRKICARASHGAEFINPHTFEHLTPTLNARWHPNKDFLIEYESLRQPHYELRAIEYCQNHAVVYHYSWYHLLRKFLERGFIQNHQDHLLFGVIDYWSQRWDPYGGHPPELAQILTNIDAQLKAVENVTIQHQLSHPKWIQSWLSISLDEMYQELLDYDKSTS